MTHLGRGRAAYLHQLVLEAFIGPCPEGTECLHTNGDASDNRLSNLRWGSRHENMADFRAHGKKKGVRHHRAKLNDALVREIRRRPEQGETHQRIADSLTVQREAVGKIVRRERWSHVV